MSRVFCYNIPTVRYYFTHGMKIMNHRYYPRIINLNSEEKAVINSSVSKRTMLVAPKKKLSKF